MPAASINLAYMLAVRSKNIMGAAVLPESTTAMASCFARIPFRTPNIIAPAAPTPPASDGVNRPPHIPPKTKRIRRAIPIPLANSAVVNLLCSAVSSNFGAMLGLSVAAIPI